MANDALNADKMNVGPGGKQPAMKDTVLGGRTQRMVDENGIPKGMKAALHERGVNTVGLKAKEMRDLLTVLETYIQERGHICVYFPKYHCELNPIERVASYMTRSLYLCVIYSSQVKFTMRQRYRDGVM